MIIQVDQEGKSMIEMFCDMALKTGGLQNLKQINLVLDTMVVIPDPPKQPDEQTEPGQEA